MLCTPPFLLLVFSSVSFGAVPLDADAPAAQSLVPPSVSVQDPAGSFSTPSGTTAGYKVTLITPYASARKHGNVREVLVEQNDFSLLALNYFNEGKMAPLTAVVFKTPDMCFSALASEAVREVLKEDFDLAFVSMFIGDCFLPHIYLMKIPFVFVNPAQSFSSFNGYRMGNPSFSSFDKNSLVKFSHPMSVTERAVVAVMDIGLWIITEYFYWSLESKGRDLELFPPESPSLAAISANASLMLVNSFRLTEHPRPYMPNIVLLGGIHCRPAQPLPKDLAEWVSSSGEAGFIFFSLGSAVKSTDIPDDIVKVLVSVFASLPQKVLWKYYGSSIPGLSDNVRLIKWAPQQDLLGNPHIRLFITHGGLLSTQEATYHGVPVLGMPVYLDQEGNMHSAEQQGWGKMLSWSDITYDTLKDSVQQLVGDQMARQRVQEMGRLTRDQFSSPANDLLWWTGYLLRTGGARHLRSGAADLYWYQLHNLDVWLMLGSAVLLLLWLASKLVKLLVLKLRRILCWCFCRSKQTVQMKKQKKTLKKCFTFTVI